jgi:hypothetical protein
MDMDGRKFLKSVLWETLFFGSYLLGTKVLTTGNEIIDDFWLHDLALLLCKMKILNITFKMVSNQMISCIGLYDLEMKHWRNICLRKMPMSMQ